MTFISRETLSDDNGYEVRCHEQLLVVPVSPPREVWVVISAEDWGPDTGPNDIDIETTLAFAIATPWVSHSWNGAVDRVTHGYGKNGRHCILNPSDNSLQANEDVLELYQHWVLLPNYREDQPWMQGSKVYWTRDTAEVALRSVQKRLQERQEKQRVS